jgi:UDP-GlcNAc:undecaprenyl-phosphate GlcNAc-1-phosphate transferase
MIEPAWAAAVATTALLWLGDLCNRRWFGWLPDDPPRAGRKQHLRPIPLAGVLLAPVIVFWMLADPTWERDRFAAAAIVVAAAVGFVDDRGKEHARDLDWRLKALGLAVASALAATSCCSPTDAPGTWCVFVALAFVLANAVNFLDNTDGVAASLAAVTLFATGNGAGWPGAAGFAALAFVPWNWPRPRLFLGDAGAYALGIAMAIAVGFHLHAGWNALAFVAVPLADFVQVVIARLGLGQAPWVGDRRHLTHIAQNLGLPRVLVAPLFAALAWALALLA